MPHHNIPIALLQMQSTVDPEANFECIAEAIREAAHNGAHILFTPEMALCLDSDKARSSAHMTIETENEWVARLADITRNAGLWLHLGSSAFLAEDDSGKRVNRSLLFDDRGRIRARYDKIHLFDVDLPTGESWRESNLYARGSEAVAADMPWGRLGLSICYDLRFPDLYRALSDAGTDMLAVPAAFTVPTGTAHWHCLLRARAIESANFVIAAAQCGQHQDGRQTFGHSLVIDPWGTILLDMEQQTGLGYAMIDVAQLTEIRRNLPALANRQAIGEVRIV